jgi:menaquinol-cytochrome c reductase iron-sulfur subunit
MAEEGHGPGLSRRGFVAGVVGILGGVIGAIVGLPAIGYLISPGLKIKQRSDWVPLGPVEDLDEGVPKLYSFTLTERIGWETQATSFGAYVVRKPDGKLDVFSNVCTHLSCRVSWQEDQDAYVCPCHDGWFAKDGEIIQGPQPRALDTYEYKVEDGILSIHLVEA